MDHLSQKLDQLSLKTAYQETIYQIENPDITIKYGHNNPTLDIFLQKLGARNWTFISAANPRSVLQSEQLNAWNNANLEIDLSRTRYAYTYALGIPISGDWPPENSFIIFDMPLDEARALSQKYNQNAILIGRINGVSRLEWT